MKINVNEVMGSSDNKEVSMIATSLKTARVRFCMRVLYVMKRFHIIEDDDLLYSL